MARQRLWDSALRMELAAKGENLWALREMAKIVISKALEGDTAMIGVIADRIDGKAAQAIVGDDNHDAIKFENITDDQRAKAVQLLLTRMNGHSTDIAADD